MTGQPPGARADGPHWLPWLFAGAAILAQISWPLTSGDWRVGATDAVVLLFAAAAVSDAIIRRGLGWGAAYAAVALLFGLTVELVGVGTGWPFSRYEYTAVLQPQVLGVPVLVPLAWTMMAYPALLVGRRLAAGRLGRILIGAWALASWDLFLDPQMVAEDYWRWLSDATALPGVPGIPVVNYLGWLAVSIVLMAVLSFLPDNRAAEGVPAVLYGWTWLGGVIANAVFLGRPAVAAWGGVAMGIVAVPYFLRLRRDARSGLPTAALGSPEAGTESPAAPSARSATTERGKP